IEPHSFTNAELELAETIASQVSVALEKANLLTQAEQRARELNRQALRLAALNEMSTRLAELFIPEEIYSTVLDAMQAALGMDYGGLMLINRRANESRLVLSTHPADDPLPDIRVPVEGNPIAEAIMATHRPIVAGNIPEDPRFINMHDLQEARGTRAMMIVPLIVGEEVIGTIGLDSKTTRDFTDAEIELAMTAANQASVAIEKSRLFTETQDRAVELDAQARRMARVNQVSTQLAETLDPDQIYYVVLTELQDALGVDFAGLVLFEGEDIGRLVKDTHPDDEGERTIPLKGNRSIEIVRETRKSLASGDVRRDKKFEPVREMLRERGTRALLIVPLIVGEEVIGTIGLDSKRRRKFTDAEIELAETIAAQTSLAIEKARLYSETLGLTIFNQAVVESIQQGIVVLDQDLNVRRINRFMNERYGWDDSAIEQPLFSYRPDYADFLREPMAVALGMGDPQVQYEVMRQDESGQPSIRNYYVYPLREGPQVTGIVLLLEDVSERARLERDLEARAVQMAALTEVSGQITSTLEPDQVINVILDALGRVIQYDGVSLWLRSADSEELVIAAARGYADDDATGVDELLGLTVDVSYSPLFGEMSAQGKVINVGDVSAGDPRFPYGSAAVYKNWLGAPLTSRGEVVGVIALEKREPGHYNELHEQLALTFANQAAVALYNAQLFAETRSRAQELDEQAQRLALLNRVSLALAQTLDLENIF
ncbi:MAG: GAF domain-containing protein, partial [Anaerolineae bacterium]|nr:GAF domain-containing protein [Anaerolineae bacterium]